MIRYVKKRQWIGNLNIKYVKNRQWIADLNKEYVKQVSIYIKDIILALESNKNCYIYTIIDSRIIKSLLDKGLYIHNINPKNAIHYNIEPVNPLNTILNSNIYRIYRCY